MVRSSNARRVPVLTILDTSQQRPHILDALLNRRGTRIGVALSAVAAVLALSILPAGHVHQSIDTGAVVHTHLIKNGAPHDALGLDHGDHHNARTVHPTFTAERTMRFDAAPALLVAVVLETPRVSTRAHVDAVDDPVIHGPPLRVPSLRAPPA